MRSAVLIAGMVTHDSRPLFCVGQAKCTSWTFLTDPSWASWLTLYCEKWSSLLKKRSLKHFNSQCEKTCSIYLLCTSFIRAHVKVPTFCKISPCMSPYIFLSSAVQDGKRGKSIPSSLQFGLEMAISETSLLSRTDTNFFPKLLLLHSLLIFLRAPVTIPAAFGAE